MNGVGEQNPVELARQLRHVNFRLFPEAALSITPKVKAGYNGFY